MNDNEFSLKIYQISKLKKRRQEVLHYVFCQFRDIQINMKWEVTTNNYET